MRSILSLLLVIGAKSYAIDVEATTKALRLANTITGGLMPASDPLFAQMVAKIQSGDTEGAAAIAAQSKYAAKYLARRMAFQMQNPSLDASIVTDSDATTFVVAHFVGTPSSRPSISTLWSENATYLVNPGTGTPVHAASLTAAQLNTVDWSTSLVRQDGQQAQVMDAAGNTALGSLPVKHVGGYVTLSDRTNDNSFAMYGATAGTNLRFIEGIWEIGTGLQLLDVASTAALAQDVPRFIPEYDPNFFHGQGQTACIACHGGGLSSIPHGYSAVADVFDFGDKGFTYISVPTTNTRKSLGSDPGKRNTNLTCNLTRTPTPVCNPDSVGVDPNHGWDLTKTWQQTGVLTAMGWTGPTSGQGLNELGSALGKAKIVYEFLAKRIVNEICPLGIFDSSQITRIAASANPYSPVKGTDDFRTLVQKIAADPSCQ